MILLISTCYKCVHLISVRRRVLGEVQLLVIFNLPYQTLSHISLGHHWNGQEMVSLATDHYLTLALVQLLSLILLLCVDFDLSSWPLNGLHEVIS